MKSFQDKLEAAAIANDSQLCVGLDLDLDKMPGHLSRDKAGALEFNRAIIDATKDLVCAYKPNFAFYEAIGDDGLAILRETVAYIPDHIPVIGDAKRGDIGNTAHAYAKAAFVDVGVDSLTVNPYMGLDTLAPYLEYDGKGIIVLCLTSNPGAADFEIPNELYRTVAEKVSAWDSDERCAFVVGARFTEPVATIRKTIGNRWMLIPGIGAQGGELEATVKAAVRPDGLGMIINASRSIIYAGSGVDYAEQSRGGAEKLRNQINQARKLC